MKNQRKTQKYIITHGTVLFVPSTNPAHGGRLVPEGGGLMKGTVVRGYIVPKENLLVNVPAPYLRLNDPSNKLVGKLNGNYVPPKAYALYEGGSDVNNFTDEESSTITNNNNQQKTNQMKETGNQILRVVVIGGSAVVFAGSIFQLTKAKTISEGVMPVITMLVGASAFSYALANKEIKVLPQG